MTESSTGQSGPSAQRSVGAAPDASGAEPASDVVPLVVDLALVVLFAAVGRRSHGEGDALTGVLATGWPFLTGCLLGWCAVVVLRRGRPLPGGSVPAGVVVWLATVVVGLLLRRSVAGGGTPPAFVVVAATVLALFLLGGRLSARLVARLRRRRIGR